MTPSLEDQLADALERERQRRELVRRRRAERDEARLREALDKGEQVQRAPLVMRLCADLRLLRASRRSQEHAERERHRTAQAWTALGVDAESQQQWVRLGFGPAEARLLRDVAARVVMHNPSPPEHLVDLAALRPAQPDLLIRDLETLPPQLAPAAVIDLSQALGIVFDDTLLERLISLDLGDPPGADLRLVGSAAWMRWALAVKLIQGDPTTSLPRAVYGALDAQLLDELVDRGRFPDAADVAADLRLYLQARTQPTSVTDDELEQLGWADESGRRDLVAGRATDLTGTTAAFRAIVDLLHGKQDSAALETLAVSGGLEHRQTALHLLEVSAGADPHSDLDADATVWPVLQRLLTGRITPLILKRPTSELSIWLGLRGLQEAVSTGDVAGGLSISGPLLVAASPSQVAELHTGRACLYALADDRRRAIAQAKAAVKKTKLPQAKTNLAILEDGRAATRLSPFLILGVDPESEDWERAYDVLYKRLWRSEKAADLNWAAAVLRGLEPTLTWFTYPLKPVLYSPIIKGSGLLRPAPQPMPRRTAPLGAEDVEQLHLLACVETQSSSSALLKPPEQT